MCAATGSAPRGEGSDRSVRAQSKQDVNALRALMTPPDPPRGSARSPCAINPQAGSQARGCRRASRVPGMLTQLQQEFAQAKAALRAQQPEPSDHMPRGGVLVVPWEEVRLICRARDEGPLMHGWATVRRRAEAPSNEIPRGRSWPREHGRISRASLSVPTTSVRALAARRKCAARSRRTSSASTALRTEASAC